MLSFFRRGGTGQVVIGAVVFAVIIVFVMEFRPGRQGGAGISRDCAVKVADVCIDRKEYFAAYGLTVPRGLPAKRVRAMGLKKAVMEGLVERELLLREADRLGVSVSEDKLDEELAEGRARVSLPTQQANYLGYSLGLSDNMIRLLPVKSSQNDDFDYKIYERVVRNTTNRSPKEFKEMQRREIVAQRMRDLVRSRVRISEAEAYSEWERDRSKAVARVVEVKSAWFTKWAVDNSDATVDDWAAKNEKPIKDAWEKNQASFKPQCPMVSELFVSVEDDAGDTTKTEKRQQIEAMLARVKKGESFELVAKSQSEGSTAELGGELGCLNEGYGPGSKELLDAVKSLKPGQLSAVVESKRGFHVLKLHGVLAEADVEKVGKHIIARRVHAQEMALALAKEFSDKLIEKAKAGEKLEDATKELVESYAKTGIAKAKPPMPAAPAAPGAAPAPKKAADSSPAIDDPLRPRVEITAPFNVTGSPVEDAAPTEAAAAKVLELAKVDDVVAKPVRSGSGFAVLQLKEKDLAKKEDFVKDRFAILRALRQAKEADAVVRYVAALRSKLKEQIVIDKRLLEESATDDSGDG